MTIIKDAESGTISRDDAKLFFEAVRLEMGKDYAAALTRYQRLSEKCPRYILPRVYSALLNLRLKNYMDAGRQCNKVISLEPHFKRAYLLLGYILGNLGLDKKCDELLGKAFVVFPGDAELSVAMGDCALARNDNHKALELYQKALERDSTIDGLQYSIGVAHKRLEHYDLAIQ